MTVSSLRSPSASGRPLRVGMILGTDAMTQSQLTARLAGDPEYFGTDQLTGNSDVGRVLQIVDRNMIELSNTVIARNYLKQRRREDLNYCDVLFNVISDPDANPESLRVAGRLMKQTDRPWINDPRNVLKTTRDGIAKLLASVDGLYVPKIARISSFTRKAIAKALQDFDFDFPVLVRKAGLHTGQTLELLTRLDQAPETNKEKGDWFVTEFVDFKSPDGIYRKYRVFFIGETFVLEHVIPGETWNVHASAAAEIVKIKPEMRSTGYYEVLKNSVDHISYFRDIMYSIKKIINLDYFGIDFGIYNDSLLLFEANAAMNQFPVKRYSARFAKGDVISSLVDLVCQKAVAVRPAKQLRSLSPPSPGRSQSRGSEIGNELMVAPDLPIKVAVLVGADQDGDLEEPGNQATGPTAIEYRAIFARLESYIDRTLIKFQVFDLSQDMAKISNQFRDGAQDMAFNLAADLRQNPRTFEKLSELRPGIEAKWINDPAAIGALADGLSPNASIDDESLVYPAGKPHADGDENAVDRQSPDGLYRKYRLLFAGPEASVVNFFVNGDALGDVASSAELIGNDPALGQEERDALIGNRPFDDGQLLQSLRQLRASIKADLFGLDCARLADGRLAILRLDPSMLDLPFRKYRGLPAWRPAVALSRLIHRRATGIA